MLAQRWSMFLLIFGSRRKVLNEGLVYFRIAYLYLCSALLSLNLQKILLRFAQYLVDLSQRFRIYNCVLQPPENLQFLIGKEETAIEARNASNIGTDIGIDSGKQLKTEVFQLFQILSLFFLGTGKRISAKFAPSFTVRQTSCRQTLLTALRCFPYITRLKRQQFDFSVGFEKNTIRVKVKLQVIQFPLFVQHGSCNGSLDYIAIFPESDLGLRIPLVSYMLLQGVSQQLHVNAQLLLFGLHPATAPSIVLRRQQRIMQVELPHFHHKDLEEGKGDVFSSEEAQLSLDFLRVVHPHCPLQRRNVIVVFLPLLEYCDFSEGRHCEVFYEIVSLGEP